MRARRTDGNHAPTLAALRALGYQCKSLHTQGGGCEDILVGTWISRPLLPGVGPSGVGMLLRPTWVLLEMKVIERKSTGYTRHTPAQVKWYERTQGFPRIIATSAEDAVAQLRGLT